jgi:hypothetical protein
VAAAPGGFWFIGFIGYIDTVIPQEFHKNLGKLGVFDVFYAMGWDKPLF